jgi:hypothetical protein
MTTFPCPKCNGTGFDRPGHICSCITKSDDYEKESYDLPDELKEIFGMKRKGEKD